VKAVAPHSLYCSEITFRFQNPQIAGRYRCVNIIIHTILDMAGPFAKGFSTANKRARSQDSPTPLASPLVPKATKVEEEWGEEDLKIPAFLRQSPSGKFTSLMFMHTQACIMQLI